jgi:hypothetical protein
MKQKQIQRVVVNVNQPAKPKRRRRAKKSAKKPKAQTQAPVFIPMPQSVIRYYDNTIPQRNIEIKPPLAETPKILKGLIPETEFEAPVIAERKPIAVPTPNPETEHVLLREEAPVEFAGEEAPSARVVVEEEPQAPVEPPPEERPDGITIELIDRPPPETTALGLADELDLAPQSTALALTQEPAPQTLALRQPTLADWGGDVSEFPLAPPAPREAWGSLVPEVSGLPLQVLPRRERNLPPLTLPTLAEVAVEPESAEPITFTFADTDKTTRKPSGMRPPTEAPKTARSLFETPAQQSRADAEQRAEEVRDELQKVRASTPKQEESAFYKDYRAVFQPYNRAQKLKDLETYSAEEAQKLYNRRKNAFTKDGSGSLIGFSPELAVPKGLPLRRGFDVIGQGAIATAGGLLS